MYLMRLLNFNSVFFSSVKNNFLIPKEEDCTNSRSEFCIEDTEERVRVKTNLTIHVKLLPINLIWNSKYTKYLKLEREKNADKEFLIEKDKINMIPSVNDKIHIPDFKNMFGTVYSI